MQEETEIDSHYHCCRWRSCLSPADLLVHCCLLLQATSWYGHIWRGATPFFRSKLKTQSFDVQIYRSLLLSLSLWLCFPSYSCSLSSHRAAKVMRVCLAGGQLCGDHSLLRGSTWDIATQFKPAHVQILAGSLISQHITIRPFIWYHHLMTLHTCLVTVHR